VKMGCQPSTTTPFSCLGVQMAPEAYLVPLERLGRFTDFMEPGFQCTDCCTSLGQAKSLKMRVSAAKFPQIRTKDNVFVTIELAIQWKICGDPTEFSNDSDEINEHGDKGTYKPASQMTTRELYYAAVYQTLNPENQIKDNAEQFFRIQVAQIEMDQLFNLGLSLTRQCQTVLNKAMNRYGYLIKKVVIRDISPDMSVRNAMNDIVVSEKARIAQITRADASKSVQIKNAEADSEVSRLHGEGVAKQRSALMNGLKKSVDIFDSDPSSVMSMLMMSQYTDLVKEAVVNSSNVSVLLNASPTSAIMLESQIKECLRKKSVEESESVKPVLKEMKAPKKETYLTFQLT